MGRGNIVNTLTVAVLAGAIVYHFVDMAHPTSANGAVETPVMVLGGVLAIMGVLAVARFFNER